MRYRAGVVALVMACVLGVVACGGDDDDTGAKGGGAPIKVMALGPLDAPQFSVPSIEIGAQAAVDAINAKGGVGGRKLELIACNDENDPNQAIACARRATQEGVVALVGGYTQFEPQVVAILERAGIPWVGPPAVQNSTSKSYYLLGGEAAPQTLAMGAYLKRAGCKNAVAIGENVPASKAAAGLFAAGVSAAGLTTETPSYGATNAADWAPVVAAALDRSSCLTFLGSPQNTPKVITAIKQSGKDATFITASALLPPTAVTAMGKAADGTILTSGYLPFTSDEPGVKELVARARKVDPKVSLDDQLEPGWAAVNVVAEAAKGRKEVTPQTLKASLDKLKGFDTGVGPVVDFTAKNPTKAFSRVTNTNIFVLEAKDGKVVVADKRPVDTAPAFEALAGAGK
jgi:ABC-type branched-subunit amino acid transport system substrate-binding protein